jgi:hypothetical protein
VCEHPRRPHRRLDLSVDRASPALRPDLAGVGDGLGRCRRVSPAGAPGEAPAQLGPSQGSALATPRGELEASGRVGEVAEEVVAPGLRQSLLQ